jgi:hypothetical protein
MKFLLAGRPEKPHALSQCREFLPFPNGSWLSRRGSGRRTDGRRHASSKPHTKNMEYAGWGSSWVSMARPMAMMAATMPSIGAAPLPHLGLSMIFLDA